MTSHGALRRKITVVLSLDVVTRRCHSTLSLDVVARVTAAVPLYPVGTRGDGRLQVGHDLVHQSQLFFSRLLKHRGHVLDARHTGLIGRADTVAESVTDTTTVGRRRRATADRATLSRGTLSRAILSPATKRRVHIGRVGNLYCNTWRFFLMEISSKKSSTDGARQYNRTQLQQPKVVVSLLRHFIQRGYFCQLRPDALFYLLDGPFLGQGKLQKLLGRTLVVSSSRHLRATTIRHDRQHAIDKSSQSTSCVLTHKCGRPLSNRAAS